MKQKIMDRMDRMVERHEATVVFALACVIIGSIVGAIMALFALLMRY